MALSDFGDHAGEEWVARTTPNNGSSTLTSVRLPPHQDHGSLALQSTYDPSEFKHEAKDGSEEGIVADNG